MFPLHKKNSMKKWFKSYSLCGGCNSVCVFQLIWIKVHYIFQYTFILFNYCIYHCKLWYISSTGPYFKQLYNVQYTCNADYITQNEIVILIKEYKNRIRLVFRQAIVSKLYTAWNTAIRILFNVPRDTHRYLIERLLKQVLSFALFFFLIYVKMTLTQFLAEIYFLLEMIVL